MAEMPGGDIKKMKMNKTKIFVGLAVAVIGVGLLVSISPAAAGGGNPMPPPCCKPEIVKVNIDISTPAYNFGDSVLYKGKGLSSIKIDLTAAASFDSLMSNQKIEMEKGKRGQNELLTNSQVAFEKCNQVASDPFFQDKAYIKNGDATIGKVAIYESTIRGDWQTTDYVALMQEVEAIARKIDVSALAKSPRMDATFDFEALNSDELWKIFAQETYNSQSFCEGKVDVWFGIGDLDP